MQGKVPEVLQQLMADSTVLKTGVGVIEDAHLLLRDYGQRLYLGKDLFCHPSQSDC